MIMNRHLIALVPKAVSGGLTFCVDMYVHRMGTFKN